MNFLISVFLPLPPLNQTRQQLNQDLFEFFKVREEGREAEEKMKRWRALFPLSWFIIHFVKIRRMKRLFFLFQKNCSVLFTLNKDERLVRCPKWDYPPTVVVEIAAASCCHCCSRHEVDPTFGLRNFSSTSWIPHN